MVQRKVPNKLLIKASSPSLKTEKNPSSTIKPSTQNHDNNAKETELAKKMNKSRSFKRSSDRDTLKNPPLRRLQWPHQPQNQPPCSSIQQSALASSSSPNYMKSTSCSEARNKTKQLPLLKPPSRPLNRSCSLKRVKILTKAPSFKSSRCTKSVNKSSTATCSSTLKDGKFPPFLDLNPGGTESQGASVVKVCPYNHCSLNGHKHDSNPPLKRLLSSRRKVLREQRIIKLVTLSPSKKMPCEAKEDVGVDNEAGEDVTTLLFDEERSDFFVEIYVKEGEDKAKGVVEEKESTLIEMDFGKTCSEEELAGGEDEMMHQCEYDDGGNFDWENATSITTTLDELFAECSDVELEEKRRLYLTGLEIGDGKSEPSDQESDYTCVHSSRDDSLCLLDEDGVKKDDVGTAFLKEFLAELSNEFYGDEITDCYVQLFSDSESLGNDVYEETQHHGCSDREKTEESLALSNKITEASETEDEIIEDSPKSDYQTISTAKTSEESSINEVVNDLENASEEQPPSFGDSTSLGIGQEHENIPLIDIENSGFTIKASSPDSEETSDPNSKKLSPEQGNHEEISSCKTAIRSRKQGESLEALKSFNPREPNYLEVEADAEAEKVDLRHQEMEERRNAEEWMLDYALRKAVDQLAPQRKTKVSLLVQAFQKVIPEARVRPISSASQACI